LGSTCPFVGNRRRGHTGLLEEVDLSGGDDSLPGVTPVGRANDEGPAARCRGWRPRRLGLPPRLLRQATGGGAPLHHRTAGWERWGQLRRLADCPRPRPPSVPSPRFHPCGPVSRAMCQWARYVRLGLALGWGHSGREGGSMGCSRWRECVGTVRRAPVNFGSPTPCPGSHTRCLTTQRSWPRLVPRRVASAPSGPRSSTVAVPGRFTRKSPGGNGRHGGRSMTTVSQPQITGWTEGCGMKPRGRLSRGRVFVAVRNKCGAQGANRKVNTSQPKRFHLSSGSYVYICLYICNTLCIRTNKHTYTHILIY